MWLGTQRQDTESLVDIDFLALHRFEEKDVDLATGRVKSKVEMTSEEQDRRAYDKIVDCLWNVIEKRRGTGNFPKFEEHLRVAHQFGFCQCYAESLL